jgi:hypothetical protein
MKNPPERTFERVKELRQRLSGDWPAIRKAIEATKEEIVTLEKLLLPGDGRPLAENVGLVIFGSLARGEQTSQSDLDWTLLINGEVDAQHFGTFQAVRKRLHEAGKIGPGATGTFGGLAFSHDVVHFIGGQDDTNKNLTLRMLLLLESVSIGDDEPRQMVIRAILKRYLADDPSWIFPTDKLPRFLLNDVIRFWRTMAVDFADKFHDQEEEKWALRNAKLRFSRKLILLTGMLACFSWRLRGKRSAVQGDANRVEEAVANFEAYFSRPPLEILADELMLTDAPGELCAKIFNAYDSFLAILDHDASRAELRKLSREEAEKSSVFQRIRTQSHDFRDALLDWLYMPGTSLCELVKEYGLF